LPHCKEMVHPHGKKQDGDNHGRDNEGGIAVELFGGKGRHYFRIDAKGREDKDVDLGMAEQPEEVDEIHHISPGIVRKEMHSEITICGEEEGRHGQRRHSKNH
jgi:hypothetical protein